MTETLFHYDGSAVVANDLARGPWNPGALHGGPVSALLGRSIEAADDGGIAFDVARLTVELLRPVPPHEPMDVHVKVVRPGRKVQLVEATLVRRDRGELARARALRIRRAPVGYPPDPVRTLDPPFAGPEGYAAQQPPWPGEYAAFHNTACEHRFVEGSWEQWGPVAVWVRLKVPVFPGVSVTALQRVAAAADFGNGVSAVLPLEDYTYINPDLTIHLSRPARGEWIGMRARTMLGDDGLGFAESELYDRNGRIGRSVQSLLIEAR